MINKLLVASFATVCVLFGCTPKEEMKKEVVLPLVESKTDQLLKRFDSNGYNVAFLIVDGVFNTEFTAPWDVFQHTIFRDQVRPMNVFSISNRSDYVTTFEYLKIIPDLNFLTDSIPHIDILVVPSAEHNMDKDLEDTALINFVKRVGAKAQFVTSHCDGAFVLAKAGLLDGVASTTFPADIAIYEKMFPNLTVKKDFLFVHEDKFVTSVGGAKSFEAALYLTEQLYGPEITRQLAEGLVIDWDLSSINYYRN